MNSSTHSLEKALSKFKLRLTFLVIFLPIIFCVSQSKQNINDLEQLFNGDKYKQVILLSDSLIKNLSVKTTNDSLLLSTLYYFKGRSQIFTGDFKGQVNSFKLGEIFAPNTTEGFERKGVIQLNLAKYYSIINKKRDLRTYLNKSRKNLEKSEHKNSINLIDVYIDLALDATLTGYYSKAEDLLEKSNVMLDNLILKDSIKMENYVYFKILVGNYKTVNYEFKYDVNPSSVKRADFLNVINTLNQVFSNYKKHFNNEKATLFFSAKQRFANYLIHQSTDKKSKYLKEAYTILIDCRNQAKKFSSPSLMGQNTFFLSIINTELGQYDKSIELIDEELKNVKPIFVFYNYLLLQKGINYLKKKDFNSAIDIYTKIVNQIHTGEKNLNKDFSNFQPSESSDHTRVLLYLCGSFKKVDLDTESHNLNKFIANLNKITFTQFKNSYYGLTMNPFLLGNYHQSLNGVLSHDNELKMNLFILINDLENIENRLAWQKFTQSRNVVFLPTVDSLEQREFELRKKLVRAKKQKNNLLRDSISNQLQKYLESVKTNYPKLADFTQDNFDIKTLQNELTSDDIVLKYIFFKDEFAVFQITKNQVKWQKKPWNETIQKQLNHHLKSIKNPDNKIIENVLIQQLIPEQAFDFKNWMIIPDTPIYHLPFETLLHNNKFLVEDKNIHYSSHLRFLFLKNMTNINKDSKVSIYVPDYNSDVVNLTTRGEHSKLSGAYKEAKTIENLFDANSYFGKEATKKKFINQKTNSNVLHLAMHATIDKDNSELSYFSFHHNEPLYLEELYALNINSDLAVLSACSTGTGVEDNNKSMASLQRGFNYAGTAATIASLWDVPDAQTSKLMVSFYQNLDHGLTFSKSLQNAKINYLENTYDESLKHPYYWAGFVLYGSDGVIENGNQVYLWYDFGILCVLALGVLLFYKFKKEA